MVAYEELKKMKKADLLKYIQEDLHPMVTRLQKCNERLKRLPIDILDLIQNNVKEFNNG